jgi:hypothetical protein
MNDITSNNIRKQPFLRDYPWQNGVVFVDGPMKQWVSQNAPSGVDEHIKTILEVRNPLTFFSLFIILSSFGVLQGLTGAIDEMEAVSFWAEPAAWLVCNILKFDTFLQYDPTGTDARDVGYMSRVIMAWQLLDTLLWASGWPRHPQLEPKSPEKIQDISKPIGKLVKALVDWPSIVSDIPMVLRRAIDEDEEQGEEVEGIDELPTTDATVKVAFRNLFQAAKCARRRRLYMALENLYSVSFLVRMFSPVSKRIFFW